MSTSSTPSYSEELAQKAIRFFSTKRRSEKLSPITIVDNVFRLDGHAVELVGIVPELLIELTRTNPQARDVLLSLNLPKVEGLVNRRGVLLCHALSPYSESIGLFCDIGRAFRIALGLGYKRLHVMLASEEWTRHNWVVLNLGLQMNLPANRVWRKALYKRLSAESFQIEVKECGPDNLPRVSHEEVTAEANAYVELAHAVWGKRPAGDRIPEEEIEGYIAELSLNSLKAQDVDLFRLSVLQNALLPYKTTLECVVRNLMRLDYPTFFYFLLQYYHQEVYQSYLKVSVRRERDFDRPFKLIEDSRLVASENEKGRDLTGLYFQDYSYGFGKLGNHEELLTAHPYYFPSGSLYKKYGQNVNAASGDCLMITDDYDKCLLILSRCDSMQKSRLIADLLSFAHLVSLKNKDMRKAVAEWLRKIDTECMTSWDYYAGAAGAESFGKRCREWALQLFTPFSEDLPIPYHFMPYLWESKVDVNSEATLVSTVLYHARESFDVPKVYQQQAGATSTS